MQRLAVRRFGLGLALLAAGAVGLGSQSARAASASSSLVSISIGFEQGWEPTPTGCLVGADPLAVLLPCEPGMGIIQLRRPGLVNPIFLPPGPQSGAVFQIVDPGFDAVEISAESPGRTPVYPKERLADTLDPQPLVRFDELLSGGDVRFGRRTFVGYDEADGWTERPLVRRVGDPTDPFLPLDGDLARATWNVFSVLITTSCVWVDDAACFNPNRPLAADRCSFNAPQLCSSLRGFVSPRLAIALEIERLRIKTRKGSSRVRLAGRFDAEGLGLEGGSFTVAVGGVAASIPLDEFRRRGRYLLWNGRGDVRAVVLSRDGRFRILAKGVDPEALEADPLPVVLQVGAGLAAVRVPLD